MATKCKPTREELMRRIAELLRDRTPAELDAAWGLLLTIRYPRRPVKPR